MENNNIKMYGKTIEDAINNIKRLSKNDIERKTITIVISKDGGRTIQKRQIKKRLFKNVYYDENLNVIVIYTYTDNGITEKYFNPNWIVNIY